VKLATCFHLVPRLRKGELNLDIPCLHDVHRDNFIVTYKKQRVNRGSRSCKPCANINISISTFTLPITTGSVYTETGKDKIRPTTGNKDQKGSRVTAPLFL